MKRGEKERWFSFIVRGCVSFSAVKENRRENGRNQKRAAHQQIKKATGSSSAEYSRHTLNGGNCSLDKN